MYFGKRKWPWLIHEWVALSLSLFLSLSLSLSLSQKKKKSFKEYVESFFLHTHRRKYTYLCFQNLFVLQYCTVNQILYLVFYLVQFPHYLMNLLFIIFHLIAQRVPNPFPIIWVLFEVVQRSYNVYVFGLFSLLFKRNSSLAILEVVSQVVFWIYYKHLSI